MQYKLEDRLQQTPGVINTAYRGEIHIGTSYKLILFAGGKTGLGVSPKSDPPDKILPIDDYAAYELCIARFYSEMVMSERELKAIGIDLTLWTTNNQNFFGCIPKSTVFCVIALLEKAAGCNASTNNKSNFVAPSAAAPKAICPECGGKGILDFVFYKRNCMKCNGSGK